jgi:hypothetical protein
MSEWPTETDRLLARDPVLWWHFDQIGEEGDD